MSAAIVYFLFAIVGGSADAASLITLSSYPDAAACTSAASTVQTAIKSGTQLAQVFCISSDDVAAFSKAAQGAK